jgi:hypothetical protein
MSAQARFTFERPASRGGADPTLKPCGDSARDGRGLFRALRNLAATPVVSAIPAFEQVLGLSRGPAHRALGTMGYSSVDSAAAAKSSLNHSAPTGHRWSRVVQLLGKSCFAKIRNIVGGNASRLHAASCRESPRSRKKNCGGTGSRIVTSVEMSPGLRFPLRAMPASTSTPRARRVAWSSSMSSDANAQ